MSRLVGPMVFCDVGDVLIRTVPGAQYREIARRTGMSRTSVAQLVRASGVEAALERGDLSVGRFTESLRRLLNAPALEVNDVEECWQAVLAGVEPTLVEAAARLAETGQLILASNTNPLHWPTVREELRRAGLEVPAFLSFKLGCVKPSRRFFTSILASEPGLLAGGAVFIDDLPDNVAAAAECGFAGWHHRAVTATAAYVTKLADGEYAMSGPAMPEAGLVPAAVPQSGGT